MQWPSNLSIYGARWALEEAQGAIAEIANAIADFEPVTMLMDEASAARARGSLSQAVEIWDIPTDDLWARDSGPIFAIDEQGRRVVLDILFNGWGGKQAHAADARVSARVAARLGLERVETGLVGEGGGVDHNGAAGAASGLIAHASSWVGASRNPGLSREEIGARLQRAYGAAWIVWADGVAGLDITDYHIDSLARFTGPQTVLLTLPQEIDPDDPFHRAALDTKRALEDADLSVETIFEPRRQRGWSEDFVASYVNYYICNGAVIAPAFGDAETDAAALDALGRAYPGRELVALSIDPLAEAGGGVHCATQQMPLGT